MKVITTTKYFRTIFAYDKIVSYRFFSTSAQIIKDVKQLESQLEGMKSSEGLAVLINGASSCGKSTLSKHLFTNGYIPYSFDKTYMELWLGHINTHSNIDIATLGINRPYLIEDMWKEYLGFKVHWDKYRKSDAIVQHARYALKLALSDPTELHDQTVYNKIYENARPILQTGGSITVDAVLNAEGLSYFEHSFSRGAQNIAYVLRYEPVLENVKRIIERNKMALDKGNTDFRNPFMVLDNFRDLYYVKSVQEVTDDELVIDELRIRDVEDALRMIKEYAHVFAVELFDSENEQKKNLDNTSSSVHLFGEFIAQSSGLCVVAQSNVDFVVTVDLLGDI